MLLQFQVKCDIIFSSPKYNYSALHAEGYALFLYPQLLFTKSLQIQPSDFDPLICLSISRKANKAHSQN